MKVCLTSFATPWFFGPYGQQLKLLGKFLYENDIEVYYLCLDFELPKKIYTYQEIIKKDKKTIDDIDDNILLKFKFLGGIEPIKTSILVSNLNNIMETFEIDVIITCMDLIRLCYDEDFSIKSLTWYPNHFSPIDLNNKKLLNMFSDIVSLSPSDYKLIKTSFPNKKCHYIPHIIDFKREKKEKNVTRKKYNIPEDTFVIFINCGNYDTENRKSLDVSLLAFEKFIKNNDGLLFIHSYNIRKIDINNHYTPMSGFLVIEDILQQLTIPKDKIMLHNDIVNHSDILDMMEMSDVLLQPSKTEGFGLPILEAQLIGIPVITNKFGAMSDYTFNGISVDNVQKSYNLSTRGFWTIPSVSGIANALKKIKHNQYDNKKDEAINKIQRDMNTETVGNKFLEIIKNTDFNKPQKSKYKLFEIISYDDDYFYIEKNKLDNIKSNQINSKWVIFIKHGLKYNQNTLQKFLLTQSNTDLVVLLTSYNGTISPSQNEIQNGNFDLSQINYAIKTKYFNVLIEYNILVKYKSGFILKHYVNDLKKSISQFALLSQ